ncbi:MAG: hypothetical protein H2069_05670 [Legionella sp.]|nr:hypothetical protein [Legionella sp.]
MKESPYASETLSRILTAAAKAGNNLEELQAHVDNEPNVIAVTQTRVEALQKQYNTLLEVQRIMRIADRALSKKPIKKSIQSLQILIPAQVQINSPLVEENSILGKAIEERAFYLDQEKAEIEQLIDEGLVEHPVFEVTEMIDRIYAPIKGSIQNLPLASIEALKRSLREKINDDLTLALQKENLIESSIAELKEELKPIITAYFDEENDFSETKKPFIELAETFLDKNKVTQILDGLFPFNEGMKKFFNKYHRYHEEVKQQQNDQNKQEKNEQTLQNARIKNLDRENKLLANKRILFSTIKALSTIKDGLQEESIKILPPEGIHIIHNADKEMEQLKLTLLKLVNDNEFDNQAIANIENFKSRAHEIDPLIVRALRQLNDSKQELKQAQAKSEQHEKNINKQENELKEIHTVKEKRIDDIFSELVTIKNNLLILAESPTLIDIKPELIPAPSTEELSALKNDPANKGRDEQALRLSFAEKKRAMLNEEIREEILTLDKLFLENPPSNQTLTDICSGINSIFTQITVKAEETVAKNLTDSENVNVKDDINVLISGGPKNTYDQIIPELKKYWNNEQTRNKALLRNITAKEAEEANPYLFNHFNLTEGARFKTDEERKKLSAAKKTDNRFERLFDISKQAIFTPFQKNLLKAVTNIDAPLDLAYLSELKKDDQKFTYLIDQLEKLVKKQEDKKNQFTAAIEATKNELAKLNEAIEKTQQLIDKPPIGAKIKDLKDYQKALKARKETIEAHQKEEETLKNDFNTALHKLTDSPINPDAPDNNLIKILKSLKSGAKAAQRLSAPDDVYVVAVVPGNDSSHKEALKLLRENASGTQNVPFMVVDRNDPNAQRALAVEEQDYNKLDSYRLVDTVPAAAQNKGYTEFQLYFKTASNHQTYLNKLDQEKDKSKLPEPETDEAPTRIKVCEPNTQFSKLHTKGENFPILANFTSKADYQKALAHAALQMATRDLQGRVGDNLQSAAAIAKLKKLELTLFAPSKEHAIVLYTAYARILEQKCNIPRAEVMKMLSVTEPTKKFTPKGDVYGPFRGYQCKGFDDKALCKFYEIKPQASEEISKEKKQALQDLIKPQPDQADENDTQQRPRLGRSH